MAGCCFAGPTRNGRAKNVAPVTMRVVNARFVIEMNRIQVSEPTYDADGFTRVEFEYERAGENFHVVIGKTGDLTHNPVWLSLAGKMADQVYCFEGL